MKKIIAAALLLLFIGTGAFAMDWAVGGGVLFNMAWTNGLNEGTEYYWTGSSYVYDFDWKDDFTFSRYGFGGFAFLGLGRYFELNLGFLYKKVNKKTATWTESYYGVDYYTEDYEIDADDLNIPVDVPLALQAGVYFKYPFVVSDMLVVFPTAGVDFEYSFDDWWFSDLWFRGGVGLDFFFTERIFLRTHFIYGAAIPIGDETWDNLSVTHGLLIKAGVGFMF